MAHEKISAMPNLAGGQVPTDLTTVVDLSAIPAQQNKRSTLNDLFDEITKNTSNLSLQFADGVTAPVSDAGKGRTRYNDTTKSWQYSLDGGAYVNSLTGTGAVGQVGYFASAGVIAGSNNHFWDNANGRLGVGVGTSPATPFNLKADGSNEAIQVLSNSGAIKVDLSSDGAVGFVGTETNSPFEILTNLTTRIRIDAAGTVGVNQATPGAQFHVTSGAVGTVTAIFASAASPSADIVDIRQNATNVFQITSSGALIHTTQPRNSGSLAYHQIITPADTTLAASTESIGIQHGGTAAAATVTRQFATGPITTQREYVFVAPTYSFVGASTVGFAATVAITNAPGAGANATFTNSYALLIQSGNLGLDASLSAIVFGTDTYIKRTATSTIGVQNNSGTNYVLAGSGGVQINLSGSQSFPALNFNSVWGAWTNGSSFGVLGPIGVADYFVLATNGPQINSPVTTGSGTTSGTVFNYNSLTSGVGALFTSSSISSGSLVRIVSTSTAAASSTLKGLDIAISGANAASGQTVTGASISVTNTNATSGTNVALTLTATNATTANTALNITAGSLATAGVITQTSASATAFESGPNGGTNPVFRLVNNTASSATGLSITGNAAGSGVTLTVLSSGTNESLIITPKGTGNTRLTSGLLQFEGATTSFPALKKESLRIAARLADDSGYTSINADSFFAQGANGFSAPAAAFFFWAGRSEMSSPSDGVIRFRNSLNTSFTQLEFHTDVILRRAAAANLALGAAANATPVANLLTIGESSRGGTDSNVGGANGTIQCGLGTGTGALASLLLRSPVAAASGTTAQTYATGLAILNGTAVLSNYTVANLPSASVSGSGARAFVTDATLTIITGLGLAPVGGGSNKVPVYSDGTQWLIG